MTAKLNGAGLWALLALVIATSQGPGRTSLLAASLTVPLPTGADTCDLWCLDGSAGGCESTWHYAYEPTAAPGYWRAGGPHNDQECRQYACQNRHGACIPPEPTSLLTAEVEELRLALVARDVPAAHAVMRKHRSQIIPNFTRLAIQVFSACTGETVAHFPVSRATFDAIVALDQADVDKQD